MTEESRLIVVAVRPDYHHIRLYLPDCPTSGRSGAEYWGTWHRGQQRDGVIWLIDFHRRSCGCDAASEIERRYWLPPQMLERAAAANA